MIMQVNHVIPNMTGRNQKSFRILRFHRLKNNDPFDRRTYGMNLDIY